MVTNGLDVVWLQKVEPVGLMVGGYFDLYKVSLGGGTYYLGMILYIDYSIVIIFIIIET